MHALCVLMPRYIHSVAFMLVVVASSLADVVMLVGTVDVVFGAVDA